MLNTFFISNIYLITFVFFFSSEIFTDFILFISMEVTLEVGLEALMLIRDNTKDYFIDYHIIYDNIHNISEFIKFYNKD